MNARLGLKKSFPSVKLSSLWGLFYGLVLLNLSVVIVGAGHGLYFPLAALNFFAFPLIPAAAAWAAKHRPRLFFVPLMAVHYIAAIALGTKVFREESGDPYGSFSDKLHSLGPYIALLVALYVMGQVRLWWTFAKSSRSQLS